MRSRRLSAVALVVTLICVGLWLQRHVLSPRPTAPSQGLSAGPAGAISPVAQSSGAAPPRWPIGERRSYELRSVRHVTFVPQPRDGATPLVAATGAREQFRIAITATLGLAVVQADALAVRVEAVLTAPQIEIGALAGEEKRRLLELLATPSYLQLSPTGQLRGLRLLRGHSAFSRGVLRALLSSLQYVRPEPQAVAPSSWTSRELDATGEYEARYQRAADGRSCRKERLRYLQVSTAQGLLKVSSLGRLHGGLQVQYELDPAADGLAQVQALRGEETLQIDPGPGMPQVQSEGSFALRYLSSQPLTDAAARADRALGDDYELIAMALAEQDPQSERRSDEQLLAGASFPDLLSQLSRLNATSDGAVRAELLSRLAALLRLQPEVAAQAQKAVQSGASEATTRTLLGALGAAGTGAAQASLVGLAENRALSADVRSNAVAMLGLGEHPSDATMGALSQLSHDREGDVRGTAALALGNAALAQRRAGAVGEAEQAVDELLAGLAAATTEDEQILYLQALGNSGDARALPAIQRVLSAGGEELRSAAVTALRFITAEAVDGLIAATLRGDPSVRVRRSAVFAASFRPPLLMLPVLQQAVLRDPEARVRSEIVPVLGRSLSLPGVVSTLQALAKNDADAEVRQAAAALLTPR